MTEILEYMPLISALIFAGILGVSMLQFFNVRKSMRIQSEQQIYTRIIEARLKIENSKTFTDMAKQSNQFQERFSLVDSPEEYYTIVALLDLFEFLYRLKKTKMVDEKLWNRWISLGKLLTTIPKFRRIWIKTRQSHTLEFSIFMDSLFEENVNNKNGQQTISSKT